MKKVEDFINCIFEKEEGWTYNNNSAIYGCNVENLCSLRYRVGSINVVIYPRDKTIRYNNFLGRYFGLGEERTFYAYYIDKEGKGTQYFEPENIYKFKSMVLNKIQDIKFQETLDELKSKKELINSLEC